MRDKIGLNKQRHGLLAMKLYFEIVRLIREIDSNSIYE